MVRRGANNASRANWILNTLLLTVGPAVLAQILLVLICNENLMPLTLVRARVVTAAVNINAKSSTTSESGSVTDPIPISISRNSILPSPSPFHGLLPSDTAHQFWTTRKKHNNGSGSGAIAVAVLLYPDQSSQSAGTRRRRLNRRGSVNNKSTSGFRHVLQLQAAQSGYRSKNIGGADADVSFPRSFPFPATATFSSPARAKQDQEQEQQRRRRLGTGTAAASEEENAQARSRERAKTKGRKTIAIVSKSSSIIHDLRGREPEAHAGNSHLLNPASGRKPREYSVHELNLTDSDSFSGSGGTGANEIHDHGYGEDGGDGCARASASQTASAAQIFTPTRRTREKRSSGGYFNRDLDKESADYEKSLRLFLFLGGLAISFFILIFLTTMLCFCCPFCLIAKRARQTHRRGSTSAGASLGGSGAIFQSNSGPEATFTVTAPSGGRSASIQMNTSPLLGTGNAAAGAERRHSTFQQFHHQRMSQDLGVSLLSAALPVPRSPRPSTSQQGAGAMPRLSVSGYNVLPYGFDPAVLPSTAPPQSQSQSQPEPMPPPPQQFAQTQTDRDSRTQTQSHRTRTNSSGSRAS